MPYERINETQFIASLSKHLNSIDTIKIEVFYLFWKSSSYVLRSCILNIIESTINKVIVSTWHRSLVDTVTVGSDAVVVVGGFDH